MNKNKVSRLLLSASVVALTLTTKIEADPLSINSAQQLHATHVAEAKAAITNSGLSVPLDLHSHLENPNFIAAYNHWKAHSQAAVQHYLTSTVNHLMVHKGFGAGTIGNLHMLVNKQFDVTDLFKFSDQLLESPVLSRLLKPAELTTYEQADKWAKVESKRGEYANAGKYFEIAAKHAKFESKDQSVIVEAHENAALAYREQIITTVTKRSDRTEADVDAGVKIAEKIEEMSQAALTARAFHRVVASRVDLAVAYDELAAIQATDDAGKAIAVKLLAKSAKMRERAAAYNLQMAEIHEGQVKNAYIEEAVVQHALVVQRYVDAFAKSSTAKGTSEYGSDGQTYDLAAKKEIELLAGDVYVNALVNKVKVSGVSGEQVVMAKASEAMIRAETAQALYKITSGTGFFTGDLTGIKASLDIKLTDVLTAGETAAAVAYGNYYTGSSSKEDIYGDAAKARAAETAMKFVRNEAVTVNSGTVFVSKEATIAIETVLKDDEKALSPSDSKIEALKKQKKTVAKWVRFANTFWAKRIAAEVNTMAPASATYATWMEEAYKAASASGRSDAWEDLIVAADTVISATTGVADADLRAKCAAKVVKSLGLLNRHTTEDDNAAYAKATEAAAATGLIVDAAVHANAITADTANKAAALLAVVDAYKHVLQEHNGGTVVMQGARDALYTNQIARADTLDAIEDDGAADTLWIVAGQTRAESQATFEEMQAQFVAANANVAAVIADIKLLANSDLEDEIDAKQASATPLTTTDGLEEWLITKFRDMIKDNTGYDDVYKAYEEGIATKLAWCEHQISSKGSAITEAERKAVGDAYKDAADIQTKLLGTKILLNGAIGVGRTEVDTLAKIFAEHALYFDSEVIDEVTKLAKYRRLAADNYKLGGAAGLALMPDQADLVLDDDGAFHAGTAIIDQYLDGIEALAAGTAATVDPVRNARMVKVAAMFKSLKSLADEAVLAADMTAAAVGGAVSTDIDASIDRIIDGDDIATDDGIARILFNVSEDAKAAGATDTPADVATRAHIVNSYENALRALQTLAAKSTATDYKPYQTNSWAVIAGEFTMADDGIDPLRDTAVSTSIATANAALLDTAQAAEGAVSLAYASKTWDLSTLDASQRQQRAAQASARIDFDLEKERLAQILNDTTPATATQLHDAYKNFARIAHAKGQIAAVEADLGADTAAESKNFYKIAAENYILAAEAKASDTGFGAAHNAVMGDLYEKAGTAYKHAGASEKETENLLLAATYFGRDGTTTSIDKAIVIGKKLAAQESDPKRGHYTAHLARMYLDYKKEYEVAARTFRQAVVVLLDKKDHHQAESVAKELSEVARMTTTSQAYSESAGAYMDLFASTGFAMHKRGEFATKAAEEYVECRRYVKAAEAYIDAAKIEAHSGAHTLAAKKYMIAAWAYGQVDAPDQKLIAEADSKAAHQARLAGGSDSAHHAAKAAGKAAEIILADNNASGEKQRETVEFAVKAYISAASAYFADSRKEETEKALVKAIELLAKIGGANNKIAAERAASYAAIAELYAEMLNTQSARENYVAAYESYKSSSATKDHVLGLNMLAKAVSEAKKEKAGVDMIEYVKKAEALRTLIGDVIPKTDATAEDSAAVKNLKAEAMLALASIYLDLGTSDTVRQKGAEALIDKADAAYSATDHAMRIKSALLRVKAISANGDLSSDAASRADMQRLVTIINGAEANLDLIFANKKASEAKVKDAAHVTEAARLALDAYNKHNFLTTAPNATVARDDLNAARKMKGLMQKAAAMARSEADLALEGYDVALSASTHAAEGVVSFMKSIANMMKVAVANVQNSDLPLLKESLNVVVREAYEAMKAHSRAKIIDVQKSALMEVDVAKAINAAQNAMNIVAAVRVSSVAKDQVGDKEVALNAEQAIENHKAAIVSAKAEAAGIVNKVKATDSADTHTALITQSKATADKGLAAMFEGLKAAAQITASKPTISATSSTNTLAMEEVHKKLDEMKKHLFGTSSDKGLLDHKEEAQNSRSVDPIKVPS